ncbi:hypothetical protein ATY81_27380 [Rhizobium sp. R72]|nr:hypothetical protein ATY81_27380 [Rhizobium sp. R72]OWV98144.1 hypothetical protein ATY80_27380 [Rhizobium sp. R711]
MATANAARTTIPYLCPLMFGIEIFVPDQRSCRADEPDAASSVLVKLFRPTFGTLLDRILNVMLR